LSGVIIIFVGFLRTREFFGFFRFPLIQGFAWVKQSNVTPEEPTHQKTKKLHNTDNWILLTGLV
jgi:hypothetical protein